MSERTVVVFGAGATKACGGPMTNEILPQAYDPAERQKMENDGYGDVIRREGFADLVDEFLVNNFNVPPFYGPAQRKPESYPGLPLLLSLIDTAIDRKEPLGPQWMPDRVTEDDLRQDGGRRSLVDLRRSLEYIIFALLDYKLKDIEPQNYYFQLLQKLYPPGVEPNVISLNYDIIADNSLISLSEREFPDVGLFPDYNCEISTPAYKDQPRNFGSLLKLHGSLNWLYCPGCHRLDIGISEHTRRTEKVLEKVLGRLYQESKLEKKYSCKGSPCPDCKVFVRPVLITPTHRKDYRNPHIARIWHRAERTLREADHVIFVGYSLPDDDIEVIYLLKRGIIKPSRKVTVVEYDGEDREPENNPTYMRYRSLFGDVEWRNKGFADYVNNLPPAL